MFIRRQLPFPARRLSSGAGARPGRPRAETRRRSRCRSTAATWAALSFLSCHGLVLPSRGWRSPLSKPPLSRVPADCRLHAVHACTLYPMVSFLSHGHVVARVRVPYSPEKSTWIAPACDLARAALESFHAERYFASFLRRWRNIHIRCRQSAVLACFLAERYLRHLCADGGNDRIQCWFCSITVLGRR